MIMLYFHQKVFLVHILHHQSWPFRYGYRQLSKHLKRSKRRGRGSLLHCYINLSYVCNIASSVFSFLVYSSASVILIDLIVGVSRHFQQYFSYIMATSFSDGRSRSIRREPSTMGKQLVNFITCSCESSAPFVL